MDDFGQRLRKNLIALNAKERDHLMRFAYLGESDKSKPYGEETTRWISDSLYKALAALLPTDEHGTPECVFAGMDYHLDWLFAALKLACVDRDITACPEFEIPHYDVPDGYTGASLQPVIGRNEDVDLLVLFRQRNGGASGEKLTLFLIEAKGIADVDKHQLARKLIRLERIQCDSGPAHEGRKDLQFRFVWVAPNEINEDSLVECASGHAPLASLLEDNVIGRGEVEWIKLDVFPNVLYMVTRTDPKKGAHGKTVNPKVYRNWTVRKRRVRKE